MNTAKINTIIYDAFLYGGLAYLLAIIIYSIFLHPIGADSGYYLQAIQYLNEGLWPYKDFQFGYTPGLFVLAPIKKLFGIGNCYALDMSLFWIIELACGFMVYKFAMLIGLSNKISKLVGLFFLIIAAQIGGQSFLLEMPSVLCGLAAMNLLQYKDKWYIALFAGVFAGLAFLFKQYGLGFLGLCLYMICIHKQSIVKQAVFLMIGFGLSCLFAVFAFGQPMVEMLTRSQYQGFDDGGNSMLYKLYLWCKVYFKIVSPILLLVPFAFFAVPKQDIKQNWKELSILVFGILGFFLQFYFGGFDHYAIYNLPFICIICAWVYEHISNPKLQKIWMILVLLNICYVALRTMRGMMASTLRSEQIEMAEYIKRHIEPNKTVFMIDNSLMAYYYLLDVQPPMLNKYGLSFGNESAERLRSQITTADYIIKEKESLVITEEFKDAMSQREEVTYVNQYEVWR